MDLTGDSRNMHAKQKGSNLMNHMIEPVYDKHSKILILGSFPSVKSREAGFYYHHPLNRFWQIIATIFDIDEMDTIDKKKEGLLKHHIALWDVIKSCDIVGSSDSSIGNVIPNDIAKLVDNAGIRHIFANGSKAFDLYMRYCYDITKIEIIRLPSTSPANAAYSIERLTDVWKKEILPRLG
jgi:TDG/mug DNA glycosylase family protein